MEKRDPANDRRAGDQMIAAREQLLEQRDVFCIALDAGVVRFVLNAPSIGPYLE